MRKVVLKKSRWLLQASGLVLLLAQSHLLADTFSAVAVFTGPSGVTVSWPITIEVTRLSTQAEGEALIKTIRDDGSAAGRRALSQMKMIGSITLNGHTTPVRFACARATASGRGLTVASAAPLAFVGLGQLRGKSKDGYDVALALLDLDADGQGEGALLPAARLKVDEDSAVAGEDYGADIVVRLTGLRQIRK